MLIVTDSIGDPPYDEVTTFSAANLTSANHPCRTKNGKTVCAQQPDTVIKAPIWGYVPSLLFTHKRRVKR